MAGMTALHRAAIKGRVDLLKILLDAGADVSAINNNGYTALHYAAGNGFIDCVKLLLARRADINSKNDITGLTPLIYSARDGQLDIVELLIDAGADIDLVNSFGRNALHFACYRGKKEVVDYLCYKGAYIDCCDDNYSPRVSVENTRDCRCLIKEHRHKRIVENERRRISFDRFIDYHIEYIPYKLNIYSICYPIDNTIIIPEVGWTNAEAIRNKYYFDEIFFYIHLNIAKIMTRCSSSSCHKIINLAKDSNNTSTLMTVLTDRLKSYLKPS